MSQLLSRELRLWAKEALIIQYPQCAKDLCQAADVIDDFTFELSLLRDSIDDLICENALLRKRKEQLNWYPDRKRDPRSSNLEGGVQGGQTVLKTVPRQR